jgi:hypothetical protein
VTARRRKLRTEELQISGWHGAAAGVPAASYWTIQMLFRPANGNISLL